LEADDDCDIESRYAPTNETERTEANEKVSIKSFNTSINDEIIRINNQLPRLRKKETRAMKKSAEEWKSSWRGKTLNAAIALLSEKGFF
jgi:hypothetical protein